MPATKANGIISSIIIHMAQNVCNQSMYGPAYHHISAHRTHHVTYKLLQIFGYRLLNDFYIIAIVCNMNALAVLDILRRSSNNKIKYIFTHFVAFNNLKPISCMVWRNKCNKWTVNVFFLTVDVCFAFDECTLDWH